ncbi:mitochondrial F1-F0 ATP synthase subunit F of fungi-domain-containing protein [Radiomyces spectabilis]|uniref:mitochondrial F1-F0 ATP synthase subunit F of fungi-domain-containing protein n=1 Tax=Radiomyces spectabilis TaxID=64574 RepID=UPI00221F266F|nr:mitochondrial F1-F0 ATP synthase subunit F of fungi-domain-containing protein [Radiomyces spectabilis]KAI8384598.1 mitochondrial F1-F0 ATP synthase subunit F of fungi-domain-containing protein [Radiomyces spectabilis]
MNAIIRRAYSTKTLIPPNVAAATKLTGSAKDAQINQLVDFYKKLPKGTVEASKPSGPWARYKARYIDGDNASITPLLHAVFGIFVIGYSIDYHFHLKHHKNVEHH